MNSKSPQCLLLTCCLHLLVTFALFHLAVVVLLVRDSLRLRVRIGKKLHTK